MYEVFLILIALIWIGFASIQDLKQREVANWLNFSLIIFALGFRFFYSLFNENFSFFYQGLIWLGIFTILGNLFYYARVFAGGDAKLLIALGVILPLSSSFMQNFKIILLFFGIFFVTGSIYGILWSSWLTIKHFNDFKSEFKFQLRKNRILFRSFIISGVILIILGVFNIIFLVLGIMTFIFSYLFIYAKTVDESCMIKKIPVKDLREGDWLYKNLRMGNKTIKANWEGLTKENIQLIKKRYRQVEIREGIPFIPVFFLTFIIWVLLRNSSWQPYLLSFIR